MERLKLCEREYCVPVLNTYEPHLSLLGVQPAGGVMNLGDNKIYALSSS